jgi:hypothetical protein
MLPLYLFLINNAKRIHYPKIRKVKRTFCLFGVTQKEANCYCFVVAWVWWTERNNKANHNEWPTPDQSSMGPFLRVEAQNRSRAFST